MPAWKEQLQQIQKLRILRNKNDEELYTAQINLQKIESQLRKAKQQETLLPADANEITSIRAKIAELEAALQELNRQVNDIDALFIKIKEINQLTSFIEKKIQTLSARVTELTRQLRQEQNNERPNRQKIQELQKQIDKFNELLNGSKSDLEGAKKELAALLRQQQEARARKDELDRKRKLTSEEIKRSQQELDSRLRGDLQDPGDLEEKKRELEEKKKRLKAALDTSINDLHSSIGSLYVDPHPRRAISNLDDATPFLLLPVRIETRFITTGDTAELWLRVYPDDIAIHTHEKTLTDKEVAKGEKYWKAIFDAEKNGGEAKETQKKNAWNGIAGSFGSQRAAWIAKETKPTNWSDDLSGIGDHDQLSFPHHDLTKTDAWSRAPRTNVLPDRFVVIMYERDTIVKEQVGNIIPDELVVGPDPMESKDAFLKLEEEQKLVFGESFNWVSDFDKAIEYGMGLKIALTPAQARTGFDKIVVLGVCLSADETEGQKTVETLIDNHHYSKKGFSIVKQGTPTNNTDQDGSGYTKNDPFSNTSYFVETGDPLFDDADDHDGKRLADALGIEYGPLQYIMNSDATDHKEAVAMNTALYPSTLGYYFDTMLHPVLDEGSKNKLRSFFTSHVSGRGSLPAIRVGDQPYGVLLTSDFSKWQWNRNEPVWGTTFLTALYKVLDQYHTIWKNLQNDLQYVGKPGTDHSEVLMNILGLQAGSVSFFQRTGYSTDDLRNRDGFKYGERYYNDMRESFDSKNILLNFLDSLGYDLTDSNGQLQVPQLLRLVFQHYHTTLDAANLVDNVPLSEDKQIRYYDEAVKKNYIHWLRESNTVAVLEKQDFGDGKKAPTALLYMQLRRSLLLELNKASVNWFKKHDIVLDQVLKPMNFHNIRPAGDLTKWEVMKAKVANALPEDPQKEKAVAEHLLSTGTHEEEAAFLNAMKGSLEFLAERSTASLERCFTEHIDTCTYRLDAWQSALFDQRLQKQRFNPNADGPEQKKAGILMGAYGYLEDVRPDARRQLVQDTIPESLRPPQGQPLYEYADNGGFVHAPSVNHATAAAVLRSGYLSHASDGQPELMAVNLSSQRIRRALFILQGIRNGQSLEALLGYQFERGLHDRGSQNNSLKKLNEYIYNFRDTFTIQQHQVQQQGGGTVVETIPANNVVNGLTLAETSQPFPYGATGSVVSATPGERTAIEEEKNKLNDTLDAIKDLLLSESVFQVVQGNFDRTGAVMNALKDSNIPPELDVINTPRSSHFSFTNRVTIQFETLKPVDAGYNPWPAIAMTPRAIMEPGLNKWLKKILGEPGELICLVSHKDAGGVEEFEEITMDKLNLQPIDLIYITGNKLNTGVGQTGKENKTAASELERRISFYYRQMKLLDDETQVSIEFLKPANAAGKKTFGSILPLLRMLKSVITDSRNLHAEDFDPPSKASLADETNPKGYDHVELLARIQQAQATFQNCLDDLNNTAVTLHETIDGITGDISLGAFFHALDNEDKVITAVDLTLSNVSALQLQQVLIRTSAFGIPDCFPQVTSVIEENKKLQLLEQVRGMTHRMSIALQQANELMTEATSSVTIEKKVAKLVEAGKLFFGDVFNILVLFNYNNSLDIQRSHEDRPQLLKYANEELKMKFVADEWLQNVAHVRPRLSKWESIRTVYESFHAGSPHVEPLELLPVQLPYRANDSWIAVEFPLKHDDDTAFNITHDTLSVIIHGEPNSFTANSQGGLLLDEWTELIPVKEEITGITFHYNQPNATSPQTVLLAVPPVEKGNWSWDELVGIINDTFLRVKLRAVEPALLDKLNKPEVGTLLPGLLANFSQYDLDIALDFRMNVEHYAEHIPITPITVN